ncbi:hypothetical protein E8E12_007146 [Didymella heteroderae]|uniref:Uncharacterized protein n=1 Tax=Didymella heteroderae TaxID=1769908 RepID=A0A9P4WWU7_9PLEO|nr:hypothetical protein E8E12_007146 [Didymella heteroderae]
MSSTKRSRSTSGTGPRPSRSLQPPKKLKYSVFKQQLRQAACDAFAAGHPAKYDQVNVVMMHFDNDDMGVGGQEDELAETFEREYGFVVEKTVGAVFTKLRTRRALEKNCLVILVFSGHGLILNDMLEVGGTVYRNVFLGNSLSWKGAWSALFKCSCSVLQILDCCHAAEATHPSVETLAAASPKEKESSSLTSSFTQAVYEQLQFMDAGKAFSVSEFAASMIAHRDALGLITFPVYIKRRGGSSIVLNKLADSTKPGLTIKAKTNNPRILLAATVEEDLTEKDLDDLKVYIATNIPYRLKGLEITLESFRKTSSSLLIINLPAVVWLQLPTDQEAYTYITVASTFTSSMQQTLIAMPNSPALLAALEPRLPSGSENIKPGQPSK